MPVQFISHHYSNKLGNSGEKQVSMKCFFILRFTPGNTETVLEMVDWFLNIYPNLIGGIPFGRTTDCTRIGTQVFLGVNIKHPAAGGFCTGIFTVADTFAFTGCFIIFPFHFWAYKLHGWQPTAEMGFTSFPFHWKGWVFGTAGDAVLIQRAVGFRKGDSAVEGNVSFLKGSFL